MKELIIYWFKMQAAKAAKDILVPHYSKDEIQDILTGYWQRYLILKPEVSAMPTIGGSLMVHLAATSTAFYQELAEQGQTEENATQLFYDIAWKIYQKMGKFSWWLAGVGKKNSYDKLLRATKLFRTFPFNSPSYQWKDVKAKKMLLVLIALNVRLQNTLKRKGYQSFVHPPGAHWTTL